VTSDCSTPNWATLPWDGQCPGGSGAGGSSGGFPAWCSTIGEDAKQYIAECGGTNTGTDTQGVPTWCQTIPQDAKQWIPDCNGGNAAAGVPPATSGTSATGGGCTATGAVAPNARWGITSDGVCERDYLWTQQVFAYSCSSGAKYACCAENVATVSNPGSGLGTCTRISGASSLGLFAIAAGLITLTVSLLA